MVRVKAVRARDQRFRNYYCRPGGIHQHFFGLAKRHRKLAGHSSNSAAPDLYNTEVAMIFSDGK